MCAQVVVSENNLYSIVIVCAILSQLYDSVIFVLIYFLVLFLVLVFQLFFSFSFVLVVIIFSF